MEEIWKSVVGYEGLYEVSSLGNLKSLDRVKGMYGQLKNYKGRDLKPNSNKGYLKQILHKDGERKYAQVHRLVAIAFLPNPENKQEVNHKNGIKTDNRVDNLEWVTTSENQKHAYISGLASSRLGESNSLFLGAVSVFNKDGELVDTLHGKLDMLNKGYIPAAVYKCVNSTKYTHKQCTFKR